MARAKRRLAAHRHHTQRFVTLPGDLHHAYIALCLGNVGFSCTSYLLPVGLFWHSALPAAIFHMLISQSLLQNFSGSHIPPCSPTTTVRWQAETDALLIQTRLSNPDTSVPYGSLFQVPLQHMDGVNIVLLVAKMDLKSSTQLGKILDEHSKAGCGRATQTTPWRQYNISHSTRYLGFGRS